MKPDLLIFSKDRPAQLDLLLRSINTHVKGIYASRTVLWRDTAPEYTKGYRTCIAESRGFTFWREHAFEANVRWWLSQAGETVSFLVDDDVFYREAEWDGVTVPWSFRGGDYDYPFSLDGNVYLTDAVEKLIEGIRFTDPTELEARAHLRLCSVNWRPLGVSTPIPHGRPCLVGVPANRVSTSSRMPHMGVHEYELNERYLKGDRLAVTVAETVELPAHFEMQYAWTKPLVPA